VLSPPCGYAIGALYGATYFARRATNDLRNSVAPLSVCLAKIATRESGQMFYETPIE